MLQAPSVIIIIITVQEASERTAACMHGNMKRPSEICSMLEGAVSGDVDMSAHKTAFYAADASSYTIRPDVVVTPADADDVAAAISVAAETGTAITARGGGTGLVGGALNCGIILDMRMIAGVSTSGSTVTAGAGTPAGELDRVLGLQGEPAMFAPNPSVGPFCTVGGMVANNAAGSRSLKYGCTIDNVCGITIIDGTGATVTLPGGAQDHDGDDAGTVRDAGRRILEIARQIDASRFPKVSKNSSGYRLDAVTSEHDTHKALVGSEGTLGVIVSARLRTVRRPSARVLYVLEYRSYEDAAADCPRITAGMPPCGDTRDGVGVPAAAEFVDGTILGNMDEGFGDDAVCALLVEYDDNVSCRQRHGAETGPGTGGGRTAGSIKYAGSGCRYYPSTPQIKRAAPRAARHTCIRDEPWISRVWMHRNASLHYSLEAVRDGSEEHVPHIIEDAAVPPHSLGALFSALHTINERYNARTVTYGHAGDGNIHVRLILQKQDAGARIERIALEYFEMIIGAGGTITGEHGDGLARSKFLEMQYGARNMRQFARLKSMFDPSNVINPGKIV